MSNTQARTTEVPATIAALSPYMSLEACAIYLRPDKPLSYGVLWRWAKRGLIPAKKLNGIWIVDRIKLDLLIASKVVSTTQPSLSPFEQAKKRACSLKTEHTVKRLSLIQKRKGMNGD